MIEYGTVHYDPTRIKIDISSTIPTVGFNMKRVEKGHVSLKWYVT